jgi:hypothetical protein
MAPHDENANSPSSTWPIGWIDGVASRYFTIWVWSIVIGVATTTTLSLTNYYIRSKGEFLALLIASLFSLSAGSLLFAWYAIIRFFDAYILRLFVGEPIDDRSLDALHQRKRAGRYLETSVRFAFLGLAFRLTLSLADILLGSIGFE